MNLATVGSGSIVEKFLEAVSKTEGLVCTAVYSRNQDSGCRMAAVNEAYNGRKDTVIYTDFDLMLKDDTIAAVYLALPNSLHFPYAKRVLQAGKHVIVEKPFSTKAAEAQELEQIAARNSCVVTEAITTRDLPNYEAVRLSLEKLGTIRMVQANFSQYSSRYDAFLGGTVPNVFNPEFAGGALYDLNIYNLHFVHGLFGEPERCAYYPNRAWNGIDTSGTAMLQYDGFQAVCTAAKDSASPNFILIQGEKGYLEVKGPASRCPEIEICAGTQTAYINMQEEENALVYEAARFDRILREQDMEECRRRLESSIAVLRIVDRLVQSV